MTRTLSSLALLLAIALGTPTPSEAPENRMGDAAGRTLAGAGGPAQELRGAPRAWVAQRQSAEPAMSDSEVAGSNPALGGQRASGAPTGSVGTAFLGGWISWADPDLGGDYLATRFPRGTLVRLCTPNRCIVRRSNDFGPSAKIDPPRIADLAVLDWEQLTGLPRSRGVALGTIEAIEEIPLPPTDAVK